MHEKVGGHKVNRLLCYSGGMDSFIAWHFCKRPATIYVPLGHKYECKEWQAICDTIPSTIYGSRMCLGRYEKDDAWIPARNLILVLVAGAELEMHKKENLGAGEIILVVQKGEMSIPDRSAKFFMDVSKIVSEQMEMDIKVSTPFANMTKVEMVRWYLENIGDIEKLRKTVGCFGSISGKVLNPFRHCGGCASCFRRSVAFEANNVPLDNMKCDIRKWNGIEEYIRKMKDGKYEAERTKETLTVLKRWGWKI